MQAALVSRPGVGTGAGMLFPAVQRVFSFLRVVCRRVEGKQRMLLRFQFARRSTVFPPRTSHRHFRRDRLLFEASLLPLIFAEGCRHVPLMPDY